MSTIIFFLSFFVGESATESPRNSSYYYDIKYEKSLTFISNYAERSEILGKFLPAPLIFQLSATRDTLFICCNGSGKIAVRTGCEKKYYPNPSEKMYFQIEKGYVSLHSGDVEIKFKKKSMI